MTTGGRGGRVIPVTNANASGAGSLHQAMIVETGPRVAWILIPNGSISANAAWTITSGDLTVWCDTRFTLNGIVLHGYASNVILHGLEIIGAPAQGTGYNPSPLFIGPTGATGAPVQNWVVDHCALMNAYDDAVVVMDAQFGTLQHSILQGRWDGTTTHAGVIDGDEGADKVTSKNCLWTGYMRLPRVTGGHVEVVECISALGRQRFIENRPHVPGEINVENNYIIHDEFANPNDIIFECNGNDGDNTPSGILNTKTYIGGNVERHADGNIYQDTTRFTGGIVVEGVPYNVTEAQNMALTRFNFPTPAVRTADDARQYVMANAGTPTRSAAQTAILDAVQTAFETTV